MRLALLALALAALACGASDARRCPGQPIGTLAFRGTSLADPDPAKAPLTCFVPAGTIAEFTATVTVDPGHATAWLCPEPRLSSALQGTLVGDALDVTSGPRDGALVTSCAANCAATMQERVTGTVTRGASGEVVGFQGRLDAAMTAVKPEDCGACGASCAVTYTVVAPPPAP